MIGLLLFLLELLESLALGLEAGDFGVMLFALNCMAVAQCGSALVEMALR